MRVALYHVDLPAPGRKPGGVAVAVHRLANALVARDHHVAVHTYSALPTDAAYLVRRLRPRWTVNSMLLREYVTPWARNVEFRGGWDIVHLHGDDWFYWRRRHPTVRTFHGSSLRESRSATTAARRVDKRLVFELERVAARLADVTVAVGPDSRATFATDLLIPNGIDLAPRVDMRRSPVPSVLFVGTWGGRKRGEFLADTFRREVRSRLPDAELWMVSDRCVEGEGVRWHGAPDDRALRLLYEHAWAFCLPSTYEGFGIPYAEALAAGTPVVATPNPGAEYILRGGRDGLIVGDEDLGHVLADLLEDETRRKRLAEAGLERAKHFGWPAIVDQHEQAYALAVERRARRQAARRFA